MQVELQPFEFGRCMIWDHPTATGQYVIGADAAESKQRDIGSYASRVQRYRDNPDYDAAIVLELETGRHVASWHGRVNATEFFHVLAALGWYYNQAVIAVERNSVGSAVVDLLITVAQYPELYRATVFARADVDGPNADVGWTTNQHTRGLLIARIHQALASGVPFTRDQQLCNELRTMQYDNKGEARARGADKDDRVMAFGIALQARYELLRGGIGATPEKVAAKPWSDEYYKDVLEEKEKTYGNRTSGSRRFAVGGGRWTWARPG
jgi:hypothetical protein